MEMLDPKNASAGGIGDDEMTADQVPF